MDIEINEVQEIIKNLESSGELSIKEEKYLKVAKLCLHMAAENVALKLAIPEPRNVEFDNDSMDDVSLAEDVGFNDAIGQMKINISKTTSTDRIVAGIKADGRAEGINFAAIRLAAAFNHGFIDNPMAEVGDVVRMILTAKEDLANDPVLAADGLSGEYAEKSLAEWEAELREGPTNEQA
jgi:hypothetical protein